MTYFDRYVIEFQNRLFSMLIVNNVLLIVAWYLVDKVFRLQSWYEGAALLAAPITTAVAVPLISTDLLVQPTRMIWQAIVHLVPDSTTTFGAPDPKKAIYGRDLVSTTVNQIYQLASTGATTHQTNENKPADLHTNFVATSLALPLLVLDKEDKIVYANDATAKYLRQKTEDLVGQNIYTALDMSFASEDTLVGWLKNVKGKTVTADHKWERVRIGLPGQGDSLQFDLAAHYNKDNSMNYETLLVMFDHTEVYSQDDQAMSFVALSVHELRTPLTLLRGYIEVFDEELGPTLNPELKGFMKKMDASGQQLAAFVDNILNVAKIEDNQLTLQLHEEDWKSVVGTAVQDLGLRAGVRGITIKTDIQEGLPKVGVDRYSIYEVLANLLDNAIKYSKGTNEIYVTARLNEDGLVETSVKDFGLGVDASILPHIFDKFYRNHRNRAQIGGTGLGLYLSRSIIDAHGGQIWVNSKVNEGSTFTFTILPFDKLAEKGKTGNNSGVTRGAHGWIKNHSMYRD
jgi:signal transduction histidine kinase